MLRFSLKLSGNAPALCLLTDCNETAIKTFLLNKLLMCSFLNNLTFIHH